MLKTWRYLAALSLVALIACGGDTLTSPSEPTGSENGTVSQRLDPTPAPVPSPTPTADAVAPYVEFANDGSGKFCNPMTHEGAVTITYTKELDLREIYGTPRTYRAAPGKCVAIPPAVSVLTADILPTLACGQTWKKRVQQDANNGEQSLAGKHLGHVFVDVEFASNACCVEKETVTTNVVTGEWGECKPSNGETNQSTKEEKCLKARTVTTTTTTTYAECQKKAPLVVVDSRTEFESCTCPVVCDTSKFWNQSFETNKNWIKGNVHVRGEGTWVLKLFAAGSSYEYPNDPDYTKDVDSKVIGCKGEGELKVEYDWKYHSSRYWWIALYNGNTRVWLSERIDKNAQSEHFVPVLPAQN